MPHNYPAAITADKNFDRYYMITMPEHKNMASKKFN